MPKLILFIAGLLVGFGFIGIDLYKSSITTKPSHRNQEYMGPQSTFNTTLDGHNDLMNAAHTMSKRDFSMNRYLSKAMVARELEKKAR